MVDSKAVPDSGEKNMHTGAKIDKAVVIPSVKEKNGGSDHFRLLTTILVTFILSSGFWSFSMRWFSPWVFDRPAITQKLLSMEDRISATEVAIKNLQREVMAELKELQINQREILLRLGMLTPPSSPQGQKR